MIEFKENELETELDCTEVMKVEGEPEHVFYIKNGDGDWEKKFVELKPRQMTVTTIDSLDKWWKHYFQKYAASIQENYIFVSDEEGKLQAELFCYRSTDHGSICERMDLMIRDFAQQVGWRQENPFHNEEDAEDPKSFIFKLKMYPEAEESHDILFDAEPHDKYPDHFKLTANKNSFRYAKAKAKHDLMNQLSKVLGIPVFIGHQDPDNK